MTDLAITGGSEAPFSFGILKAWEAMRVVSPETCRPFSKDRRGMILGEGAAMFVIEPLEAALARGARDPRRDRRLRHVRRRLPHHPALDGRRGARHAGRAARRRLAPEQIGYINAHGTATPANDPTETAAIRNVFGAHADRLAGQFHQESMHGHALGAAAALECLATSLALRDGVLPPTANFSEPDPECDLDVIPNVARGQVECAISNSFAFGGLNAVLVLKSSQIVFLIAFPGKATLTGDSYLAEELNNCVRKIAPAINRPPRGG